MNNSRLAVFSLIALASSACGSAGQGGAVDDLRSDDGVSIDEHQLLEQQDNAVEADEEVLHTFSAGETKLSFVRYTLADQSTQLMMREDASAFAKQSIVDRLESEVGPLTLLELFYAFAPDDAAPHQALVSQHEVGSLGLGRDDAAVKRVRGQVDLQVEKSVAACEGWVYASTGDVCFGGWSSRGKRTSVTGSQGVCLNDDCGLFTLLPNTSGACSESNNSVNVLVQIGNSNVNGGDWVTTGTGTVAPFAQTRWRPAVAGGSNRQRLWIAGNSSGTYHLRTGNMYIASRCVPR
jgi:hypothetical protein